MRAIITSVGMTQKHRLLYTVHVILDMYVYAHMSTCICTCERPPEEHTPQPRSCVTVLYRLLNLADATNRAPLHVAAYT